VARPNELDDLGLIEVAEGIYAADLALLDRYHGFSSELLRLALIGIAAFGFLLEQFDVSALSEGTRWMAGVSMGLLVLSTAASLAHRYLSSDGMFHHIRLVRRCLRADKLPAEDPAVLALKKECAVDRRTRGQRYKLAGRLLGASSVFLALGAATLVFCLILLLITPPMLRS
jgi:hypothetical protein